MPSRETWSEARDDIIESEGDEVENEVRRAPEELGKNYTKNKILKAQTHKCLEISQDFATSAQSPISLIGTEQPEISHTHIQYSKNHRNKLVATTKNDNEIITAKEHWF